jgi:hypothetical protein
MLTDGGCRTRSATAGGRERRSWSVDATHLAAIKHAIARDEYLTDERINRAVDALFADVVHRMGERQLAG